jgi:hypothetical protein
MFLEFRRPVPNFSPNFSEGIRAVSTTWRLARSYCRRLFFRHYRPFTAKTEVPMHERVPIPSLEEQRELKLENARAEARLFDITADLQGALAANQKAVAIAANAKRSGNEAAAAASAVRAAEARERITKIEAGAAARRA